MMFSGSTPIFIQLASYYKKMILSGAYLPGDALPSVREVAISERINPNTAQRAYALLVEEGLIVSLPKKGYFVAEHLPKKEHGKLEEALSALLAQGYSKEDIMVALDSIEGGKHDSH